MAFCGQCGNPIEDGAKFCPRCGTAVVAATPAPETAAVGAAPASPTASQAPVPPQAAPTAPQAPVPPAAAQAAVNAFANLNNTADTTAQYDPQDIANNKAMGVLAYLGILVLVPILGAKQSKFARFHANQGLTLLGVEVIYSIVSAILRAVIKTEETLWGYGLGIYTTPTWLNVILGLISIPLLVLAILGIVNAAQGKAKELPLIGKFQWLK